MKRLKTARGFHAGARSTRKIRNGRDARPCVCTDNAFYFFNYLRKSALICVKKSYKNRVFSVKNWDFSRGDAENAEGLKIFLKK